MEKILNYLSVIASFTVGIVVYLLGGGDVLLKTLLTLIVIDYITGVFCAIYKDKKLSSKIGLRGIIKKFIILCVVAGCTSLENILPIPIRETVIVFLICNEGISFLENAGSVISLPAKLKDVLLKFKDENEKSI